MALAPCPACGLPRAAADIATPCPACRWADPAPPPPLPAPAPPSPPAPEPQRPSRLPAAVLGVICGVLATLAVQSALPRPEPDPVTEPVPEVAAAPVYPRVPSLPVAPPPRLVERADPVVLPVPVPAPANGGFAVLKVDQPDDLYHFPRLGPGNKVKLTGRVKKLTVDGLDAGAELDASGLATDGVSVAEAVEGGVLRVA
ncbi:MAG TPA: hypothetical protein VD866_22025, partial [Urbifossiella sp.]|nr:hypothetical protein [Urbifossiella sp.]